MGDENSNLSATEARHLLRRTGFGAKPADVTVFTGMTRGAAADKLLAPKVKGFKPGARDAQGAHDKWLKYILKSKDSLSEKLVLFWHDHFATGATKVADISLMAEQIKLLHLSCKGNFKTLVKAINKNAAMMEYLDTVRNEKDIPNENYSREVQELFTLGVLDSLGNANYTQDDIVQIARAFTGWSYSSNNGDKAVLQEGNHDFTADFPERGQKVIYQTAGGFGPGGADFTANGEGEAEIDTVIDIIFAHQDSDSPPRNTVGRRTARRLLEYFAHPNPALTLIDEVVTNSGFVAPGANQWSISALVRAILVHDAFYDSAEAAPFSATTKKSVKWPIDYVLSTLRQLNLKPKSRDLYIAGGSYTALRDHLSNMGQILLEPPSVFGWDWETSWLSSATLLARYTFARDLTSARGGSATAFRPDKLISLSLTAPGAIVDAVTDALGVTDQFSTAERTALVDYLGVGPINLNDYDVRNTKLNGLFALVLESPAYMLH